MVQIKYNLLPIKYLRRKYLCVKIGAILLHQKVFTDNQLKKKKLHNRKINTSLSYAQNLKYN